MPSAKIPSEHGSTDTELSASTMFDVLADRQRRFVLHYLAMRTGPVSVSDLADRIAHWEGDTTQRRFEDIRLVLVHAHLPKLADTGVVRYDADQETVRRLEAADQASPYLDLVVAADIRS